MKKAFFIYFFLSVAFPAVAHDDIAYRTTGGWDIDFKNNTSIDTSILDNHSKNIAAFAGDYNGDGYMDFCYVNTDMTWNWYLGNRSGEFDTTDSVHFKFGVETADQCLVGDFTGDGKTDIAVARTSSTGNYLTWYVDYAPCDRFADVAGQIFGLKGDIPLSGDFNGDGITDICVYRPSESKWYVSLSHYLGYPMFQGPYAVNGCRFGSATDLPLVGDFNGDGYDDMALYRSSDNKIYVNCFNPVKPKMEGFADLSGWGSVDLTIVCPVEDVSAFMVYDFDRSRPEILPLATQEELGSKVQLRHGWTCIFDNSLDVDKWVKAWEDVGINTLEYHSWIRAHEEIAPQGNSWNTYVGDDRLWTSKAKMKEKILKFKASGGRSICYTGIYAASPAFAHAHPHWAMRDNNNNMLSYGNGYLYMMATNENVNSNSTINGKTFKNFNDYFTDQAVLAQQEYDWDGWRWDWYGFPGQYNHPDLSDSGDFYTEIGLLTDRLDSAVKNIRSDVTTTTLQLPNAGNNVPFNHTATVVDHQFLELWPESNGTGDSYADLYHEIYKAKSGYPDKPLFANFYPPLSMNLKTSWPCTNIRYQFATCLTAGGYPAAQVVDGIAGFTDPLPFHATQYPVEVLTEISKWNRFAEAYGAYYYYSNERYLIRDSKIKPVVIGASKGLIVKMKERRDKHTRRTDALVINLVDYGTTPDLKWVEINQQPAETQITVEFRMPEELIPQKAYWLTPDGRQEVSITSLPDNIYSVSIDHLSLFASIVLTTQRSPEIPAEPEPYATVFQDYNFEYDTRGDTQVKPNSEQIIILDEETPLIVKNSFNNKLSAYEVSDEAYTGKQSVSVQPGLLYFNSNSENAFRIPVDKFKKFKIAVKGNNASSAWFGFKLLKPSSTSSVWETKDIYYRIGTEQSELQHIVLSTANPSDEWTVYERNLLDDIKNHPSLTLFWQHAIVVGIYLGPIDNGNVLFDSFEFMTDNYNILSKVEINSLLEINTIKVYNSVGNLQLLSKSKEVDTAVLSPGVYILEITTNQGAVVKKVLIN